jgi:hypothetical protein
MDAMQTIATALEKCGLKLGDVSDVTGIDEFARLVEVAAMNVAAGKKKAAAGPDDFGRLDPNPAPEVWYGENARPVT